MRDPCPPIEGDRPTSLAGPLESQRQTADPRFSPTVYTAALLEAALEVLHTGAVHSGFELGVGGGYVMASLLQAGVERFEGVDILPDAVAHSRGLLERLGLSARAKVEIGDLWGRHDGRRFDLIVANLPQFPLSGALDELHPPTWSDGGPDGRRVIDPFIAGLATHLAPGGTAVMTHNIFVNLQLTLARARADGLQVRERSRHLVPLSPQRAEELQRGSGRWGSGGPADDEVGLTRVGPQLFAGFVVLELRKQGRAALEDASTPDPLRAE